MKFHKLDKAKDRNFWSVRGYYTERFYNEYDESRLGTMITVGRRFARIVPSREHAPAGS